MAKQTQSTEAKIAHAITTQINALLKQRDEIVRERAMWFSNNGFALDDNKNATMERSISVAERARALLNGHGGQLPIPQRRDDATLADEQAALDLAIQTLRKSEVKERVTASFAWQDAKRGEYLKLAREFFLHAVGLERTAEAVRTLIRECPDRECLSLPLQSYIVNHYTAIANGTPIREIAGDAVTAGLVSNGEIGGLP